MKKYFIALCCLSACTLLIGCSSPQAEAIQSLENQLTRVENIVGNGNISTLSQISSNGSLDLNTSQSSLQSQKHYSYENMLKEDNLRNDINSMVACIKNCAKKDLKITKNQANLIKQLSNNIAKNTTSFNSTTSPTQSNANKIAKSLKSYSDLNLAEIEGNYLSLSNDMNERYAYMSNIYSNLEKIYTLLDCDNCTQTEANISENCEKCNQQQTQEEASKKNIDTFENTAKTNRQLPPNNQFNCPNCPTNNYYSTPPYNNQFNYGRNTDSFYPRMRNIDTYRQPINYHNYPAYQNGYYNYPVA